jgi:sortase A
MTDMNPTPTTATRTRRGSFYIGVILVLTGLCALGYVGWQMYGTNMVARGQQETNLTQIDEAWAGETGNGEEDAVATEHGVIASVLRIPRFGDDWRMPIIESVSEDALAVGVGHFPDSVDPGEKGNYAIAAHRVTHGEPFRNMPSLQPGDKVIVETSEAVYTYVLETGGDDTRVTFTDTWVLKDQPIKGLTNRKVITLLTCAELFHTDDRLAAFGHLESVVPKNG